MARLSFLTPASSSICLSGPSCPWLGGIDSCLHNFWPVSEAVGTDVLSLLTVHVLSPGSPSLRVRPCRHSQLPGV